MRQHCYSVCSCAHPLAIDEGKLLGIEIALIASNPASGALNPAWVELLTLAVNQADIQEVVGVRIMPVG